jgi:hypothetical protein
MGGGVLDDKTLVALHALVDGGLLNRPLADVRPFLVGTLGVLLGVRGLPPLLPVIGELLEEGALELAGLQSMRVSMLASGRVANAGRSSTGLAAQGDWGKLTVKVGRTGATLVADSATELSSLSTFCSSAFTAPARKAALAAAAATLNFILESGVPCRATQQQATN